ncbi:protein of unknown function DUF111 [Magnetococcus marinus MC-1]|uniref:Putative nickel insertion protein n=1 Tax=Magnetococcus marinus (strain ATCC BAA-1437 / JCM 17883 / MC-1) TaxID=156889 RepID=A0L8K0_MAGMM|nr:nickel pincer cofactor biosynthesis protein LarC [Magnetococcus marinus]ABK44293.1 protein of unknown function DUF111 [Magnetococcus marinus MC-1]
MDIYLDLSAGIAGDMFVAACIDLGADQQALVQALQTLQLPPWQMQLQETTRGGLRGKHLRFDYPPEHHHRHLSSLFKIIEQSQLSPAVQRRAQRIFTLLAQAEAHVHGVGIEQVHFHEVGAVDAILDICAAAWCLEHLDIEKCYASPLAVGSGRVGCAHGTMAVPVPAVAYMLQQHDIPLRPVEGMDEGELATPTGVAILAHLAPHYGANPLSRFDRQGAGLGSRECVGRANRLTLFAMQQRAAQGLVQEAVTVLVAHIDDMDPQWQGPLFDAVLQAGGLDLSITPTMMKKGRMGARLELLCHPPQSQALAQLLLNQTTTLGVRQESAQRWVLPREVVHYATPWGALRVKWAAGVPRLEHDDLLSIAQQQDWGLPMAQWQLMQWLAEHHPQHALSSSL